MTREQLDALKVDLSDYANWAPTTRILVLQMFEEYASQRALIEQQAKEMARLKEAINKLQASRFPIQKGPTVPWVVMKPHEAMCQTNHQQSLQRIAERGGFSPAEAWCVVSGINLSRMRTPPQWDEYEVEWRKFAERVNREYALPLKEEHP